jgi:hypothetical protein
LKNLLFILALVVASQGRATVFPISLKQGFIITEAIIEGRSVLVILDSGAPGLVLNQKYYESNQDSILSCSGIYGDFECRSRLVKRWEWLGVANRNTSALVTDLSFLERSLNKEVHALIGLSVLHQFYVEIDYDQQVIRLEKDMQEYPTSSFNRFQYVNHLPVITCKVNGEKKILGLDTGSECNFLFDFTPASDQQLQAGTKPIIIVGTDNKENLKHRMMMDLEVNEYDGAFLSEFIVDFDNDRDVRHLAFDGMLGQPFLTLFNIIIHPGKQRILLLPREASTPLASAIMP